MMTYRRMSCLPCPKAASCYCGEGAACLHSGQHPSWKSGATTQAYRDRSKSWSSIASLAVSRRMQRECIVLRELEESQTRGGQRDRRGVLRNKRVG